jgi:DNA-binding SARP family transcriptional activator
VTQPTGRVRFAASNVIEFRVLGPLQVESDGRAVEIGSGKRRALLAVLLLHANEVVSTDRLIDELWGDSAPATAPKIVQGYISQLRKSMGGGDDADDHGLVTRSPGYVLRLHPDHLDSHRSMTLVAKGRAALSDGAADEASRLLHEALGMWRGPPLADFAFESFAQEEISRLDELRLTALEERIDADLALGRHAALVGELEGLIAAEPDRERPRAQLMLALYRSGRQAEALTIYQVRRRELQDSLGLEPSRTLRDLEQAILRQDPSLDLPPAPRSAPVVRPAVVAAEELSARGGLFVGRERELDLLAHALGDALKGRGRLLMIGGEPGIGKSRLADELAGHAREQGADVLWGRCWEAGGAPPYWPWAQILRAGVRSRSYDQVLHELGSDAGEIADLVPDVRQLLPAALKPPSVDDDPQAARFRLFDAVANFLLRASQVQPVVVVLDDLNWADKESLLLLEFLTHELLEARLLVVGTYRDVDLPRHHPLAQVLGDLAGARVFERVLLSGLSRDDVRRFIEAACGFPTDTGLVDAVHAHTEGNPFFVQEVVQLLLHEGALTSDGLGTRERWEARIPDGVREAIGRRLERLSPFCNETLTVAAALGREFTLAQVAQLSPQRSEDEVLEVLEEALSAHIIEEPAGAAGRYQFTHALIQATLLDEISQTRRARLHAHIAEALETLYGNDAENRAAELAHHFAEGAALLGTAKLIRYSALAGEAALAARAPAQALSHFERALAAKGVSTMDDETAALLFGIGRAQLAVLPIHELKAAITNMNRAVEYYAAAGDIDRAVAVGAYPLPLSLRFGYTDAAGLIARALTLVSPGSHDAGRLLAQHGWFTGFIEGDYRGAQALFRQALAIAERERDAALERRTLSNSAFVDVFHLRWEDCISKASHAIELAEATGDADTEMAAHRSLIFASVATGQRERALTHADRALSHAKRVRENWWLTSTSFSNAVASIAGGDWEVARELSEFGLEAAPSDPRHLALRAVLEHQLGHADEGAKQLERLHEVAAGVSPPGPLADHVFCALATSIVERTAGSTARSDVAQTLAEGVLALPRLINPALRTYARSALGFIAVERHDAGAAMRIYEDLESQGGTASFFIPFAFARLLALLAVTVGHVDAALAHFAEALAFCEGAGYRPEYAWTASDLAEVLLVMGDEENAVSLLDNALQTAQELGMRPLADRVLAHRTAITDTSR